jgi:hypothetical protein
MTDLTPLDPSADILARFDLFNVRLDSPEYQKARKARLEMIKAARDYYKGDHPQPLKVKEGEHDDNVIVNLCRSLINRSVAWLFGDSENGQMLKMTLPIPKDAGLESGEGAEDGETEGDGETEPEARAEAAARTKAEEYLEQVWKANGGARLLMRLGRRVSVAGHGFIKVLPVGDPGNDLDVPRIVPQRSENAFILTKQDDADTVEAYVIEWQEKRANQGAVREVRVRQLIANVDSVWWVGQYTDTGHTAARKWVPEKAPAEWPHDWSPIVDWQNISDDESIYGLSDLEDVTRINDAINFTASNVARIIYIHGHPRTVGIGFEAREIQSTQVDAFWTVLADKTKADIKNLEMQGDLGSSFTFLNFLLQSFWDIGRELDLASLRERIGQVTNFGLKVLANAALSKLGEKRLNYGDALNRINRILLELGGFPAQDTELKWLNPLPADMVEEIDRLAKEVEMKITSRQTAAEDAGRDWEAEKARIGEERDEEAEFGAALLEGFERGAGPGGAPGAPRTAPAGGQRPPRPGSGGRRPGPALPAER